MIRKVLIVDDDEDVRYVTELAASRIGKWETVLASGGREGVEKARSDRPDVILLDVMMPDVDGPATLVLLREDPATADIPVIFLTARSQQGEVESYKALGACGVIVKPFEVAGFADQVREIVGGR
ncbi:MAG: response regulator [Myxococcota bacterium]